MTLVQKLFKKLLSINSKFFIVISVFHFYLASLFILYKYKTIDLMAILR